MTIAIRERMIAAEQKTAEVAGVAPGGVARRTESLKDFLEGTRNLHSAARELCHQLATILLPEHLAKEAGAIAEELEGMTLNVHLFAADNREPHGELQAAAVIWSPIVWPGMLVLDRGHEPPFDLTLDNLRSSEVALRNDDKAIDVLIDGFMGRYEAAVGRARELMQQARELKLKG
jgi:hypothetical protein